MLMRSLLALSFVALLAPLHASSSSVEDSELNALSARLRARNLQVDRLQRVSADGLLAGVFPCTGAKIHVKRRMGLGGGLGLKLARVWRSRRNTA